MSYKHGVPYRRQMHIDISEFLLARQHIPCQRIVVILGRLAGAAMVDTWASRRNGGITFDDGDDYFIPNDEWEAQFWQSCRNIMKEDIRLNLRLSERCPGGIEGHERTGKRGRPRKNPVITKE